MFCKASCCGCVSSPRVFPAPRANRRWCKPKWVFIFCTAVDRFTGWSKTLSRPWPWPRRGGCRDRRTRITGCEAGHEHIFSVFAKTDWVTRFLISKNLFKFGGSKILNNTRKFCTFSNFRILSDWLGVLCRKRVWTLGVSAESLQVMLTWMPLLSGLLLGD